MRLAGFSLRVLVHWMMVMILFLHHDDGDDDSVVVFVKGEVLSSSSSSASLETSAKTTTTTTTSSSTGETSCSAEQHDDDDDAAAAAEGTTSRSGVIASTIDTDSTSTSTSTITTKEEAEECQSDNEDSNPQCAYWASIGECENNPQYMQRFCKSSCGITTCDNNDDNDDDDDVIPHHHLELKRDARSKSIGVPQVLNGDGLGVSREQIQEKIDQALEYVASPPVLVSGGNLVELCRNQHELCAVWAALGECTANPIYMQSACAPICQSCDKLTIESRCPLDPNAPKAWKPGSLHEMFERLTSEPYLSQHNVQILSSPGLNKDENHIAEGGDADVDVVDDDDDDGGPWVITMDDVISAEEAERLIELGAIEGYKESTEVDKPLADGRLGEKRSGHRTSYNSWCQNDCYRDDIALRVVHRLSNLTGIDEVNSEYLQLLRYEPGQYYLPHHDFIPTDVKRQQGPRILTVFLYLNDVEEGGETEFTSLGPLRVAPKRGRALLWPSVLNDAPDTSDPRTYHQALKVKAGIKYGANAWFHLHDFKTPNRNGCQG